ncbi:MAG TPA: N-acetylmuramoyl-L-alanine amidase [Bacteroidota bacterium]|nr:N-acetylmuramoyl-L-alanine amidase [Bacteroidota bacterium]
MKVLLLNIVLLLFLWEANGYAENNDATFMLVTQTGDTTSVQRFDSAGVSYLALNNFFDTLHVPIAVNDSMGKIEVLLASQLVRFTDRNPFVVITERTSNNSTVYQLPSNVIRRRNTWYAPAFSFLPLFQQLSGENIRYDTAQQVLSFKTKARSNDDITDIHVEKKLNGYLINIGTTKKIKDIESWLKPDGWLFITMNNARGDTTALSNTKPLGVVKQILAFQSPSSLQLTFRVSSDVEQAEVLNDPTSDHILVSLHTRSSNAKAGAVLKRQEQAKRNLTRNKWKLDVIVIDAGHGGKDPGTIGVTRTREKDVTLAVALKLGALIEQNLPGVKVIYTRKTDTFVELYRRTQIANEAGGKLFVSIHCNSLPHPTTSISGFEIYLLRPGRTQEAIAIASRENEVVQLEDNYQNRYQKLTEEEFILVTMAQSAYMKYSEQFADIASHTMAKNLKIKNSGVKQAGFYVLVGASMPNALVELGYLSNRREEQVLRSASGQDKIAQSLFNGIKQYKAVYEKTLQEGLDSRTDAAAPDAGE